MLETIIIIDMAATIWKDNINSTGIEFCSEVTCEMKSIWKIYEQIEIPCLFIVQEYNKHMGSLDLAALLSDIFKLESKCGAWDYSITDVSVVNG